MYINKQSPVHEIIEDEESDAPLGWDFYWQEYHSGNTGKLSRRDEDSTPDSEKVTAPLDLF